MRGQNTSASKGAHPYEASGCERWGDTSSGTAWSRARLGAVVLSALFLCARATGDRNAIVTSLVSHLADGPTRSAPTWASYVSFEPSSAIAAVHVALSSSDPVLSSIPRAPRST